MFIETNCHSDMNCENLSIIMFGVTIYSTSAVVQLILSMDTMLITYRVITSLGAAVTVDPRNVPPDFSSINRENRE